MTLLEFPYNVFGQRLFL